MLSDWHGTPVNPAPGPTPGAGQISILVKWNRSYENYISGYKIYAGLSRDACTTALVTITNPDTTQYLYASSTTTNWYKIVPTFDDGAGHTWDGSDAASQYFTKSLIPTIKLGVYEEVVAPGDTIHISLGANIPSTDFTLNLCDPNGNVITSASITTNSDGFVNGTMVVPLGTGGGYTLSTTVASVSYSDTLVVSARAKTIINQLENDVLADFQQIQVHNEGVIESNFGNTIFKYAFGHWNRDITPEVLLDGQWFQTQTPYIDWDSGIIGMHGVDAQDLYANYAFRFFTQTNFYNFALNMVKGLNAIKPYTHYTIDSMPEIWDYVVILGVYRFALRKVLSALTFRDMRLATIGEQAVPIIQQLLTDATSEYNENYKNSKGRWMLTPTAVISGRYRVPIRVSGESYMKFVGLQGLGNV